MSDFAGNSAKLAVESIRNSRIRDHYIQVTQHTADAILKEAECAQLLSPCQRLDVWKGAAMKASNLRNTHMETARRHMSPTALAFSKLIKNKCPTFPEIWKRYKYRLYETDDESLEYLNTEKQANVFRTIIRASGRTNTKINIMSKALCYLGALTLLLTLGLILYNVYKSNNPVIYVTKCIITFGGGMFGAYIGSTVAFTVTECYKCNHLKMLICSVTGGLVIGFASALFCDVIITMICDKSYNFDDSFIFWLE